MSHHQATAAGSPDSPSSTQLDSRHLPADELHGAIRRAQLGFSRDEALEHVCYELAVRHLVEGRAHVEADFDEDGFGGTYWLYPDEEYNELAAALGYDPASPEIQEQIREAQEAAENDIPPWDDWDSLEARDAHHFWGELTQRVRESDTPQILSRTASRIVRTRTLHRTLLHRCLVRPGRARRVACNTRSVGSRRRSGSSPPKSGDDPPGEPPDMGPWPHSGPLHPALAGGRL